MSLSRADLFKIADESAATVCPVMRKPADPPSKEVIGYIRQLAEAHTAEDQKFITLTTPMKVRDEYERLGKAKVKEIGQSLKDESGQQKVAIKVDPSPKLMPMSIWFQQKIDDGDPRECKPCLLGPILNWYHDLLKENSVDEQAARLEKLAAELKEEDVQQLLNVCQTLDDIKQIVTKAIRIQLEEYDKEVQGFKAEVAAKKSEKTPGIRTPEDILNNPNELEFGAATKLLAKLISTQLNVKYDGAQYKNGELAYLTFTDPVTGSTFGATSLAGATQTLKEMREKFHVAAKPIKETELLKYIRSKLDEAAKVAQGEYDSWEQDEQGQDEELGAGGICDEIAKAVSHVFNRKDVDIFPGGQDGDDHMYIIVQNPDNTYGVDLPADVYETGGGYHWKKIPGVVIKPSDFIVWEVERQDPEDFE